MPSRRPAKLPHQAPVERWVWMMSARMLRAMAATRQSDAGLTLPEIRVEAHSMPRLATSSTNMSWCLQANTTRWPREMSPSARVTATRSAPE